MTAAAPQLLYQFQEAEMLMAAGNLKQAAVICKDLLDRHPEFPYGYYLMSSLFRATGTYSNALTFSQMAIQLEPNIAAFHLQQGQIFFSIGDNEAAAQAFQRAHMLDPTNAIALLLWADAMAQQNQFDDATLLFDRARQLQDIPEIDLHEGLCHMMRGAFDKAEQLLNRVVSRSPDYDWGHIQKGKLMLQTRRVAEAEACFARALKCNPVAYEALHGMAMASEMQGHTDMAIQYAMQAIQAHPQGWESHMQLGSLLLTQHHYDMAEQILAQAHDLQPRNPYITQLLILTLRRQNKQEQIVALIDKLLGIIPDDGTLHYFRAMARGETTTIAPPEYVAGLFDHYAERFDHYMVQVLHYKIPELLAQMASQHTQRRDLSLLDLGCGTGLLGEAFRDITDQRIGVDLSANMLGKARSRKLYKALFAQDITDFMHGCEQRFDLVAAADVFIYLGDLAPVLGAARAVLADGGLLLFSIEKEDSVHDYQLKPTGRYTHSPAYVAKLATEEGYRLVGQQDVIGRMENDMPVPCSLFALSKIQTH